MGGAGCWGADGDGVVRFVANRFVRGAYVGALVRAEGVVRQGFRELGTGEAWGHVVVGAVGAKLAGGRGQVGRLGVVGVCRDAPKMSRAAIFRATGARVRRLIYQGAFPPRGSVASVTFRSCDVAVMSTGLAVSQAAWRDAEFAD